MSENSVTLVGNFIDDPELRFTAQGAAVANFRIAVSKRIKDPQTNEWKDGDTSFFRINVWRQLAENVAESLTRGTRVVVTGTLKMRQWETQEDAAPTKRRGCVSRGRKSAPSAKRRPSGSTTRTPSSFGSSCLTAARFARAGSPARARSTSVTSRKRSRTRARWRCCLT